MQKLNIKKYLEICKNGNINYSSIHARVAAVYSALCEGKIKINELNRIED